MRISDWSSDVCSSDLEPLLGVVECRDEGVELVESLLPGAPLVGEPAIGQLQRTRRQLIGPPSSLLAGDAERRLLQHAELLRERRDRKSVVSGKSVSVRVDPDGRRIIKKKNQTT